MKNEYVNDPLQFQMAENRQLILQLKKIKIKLIL